MTLAEREEPVLAALRQQAEALKRAFDATIKQGFPRLDGIEVTSAVLKRMKAYADVQNEVKQLLNKRKAAPAAEFFAETILFFVSLYCRSLDSGLEVHSERPIKQNRGQMTPDISIWRDEKVVAIIECKTQLGWSRNTWRRDFEEREERLRAQFPGAKAFLLVYSGDGMDGFTAGSEGGGNRCFVLLDKGVKLSDVSAENLPDKIVNRIESLLSELS